MQMIRTLLVGILFSWTLALCGQAPVSVCDLVAHRAELNNKIVTVRGIVEAGGHGTFLSAAPSCTYTLMTRGVLWPNIIALSYPNNSSLVPTDHAKFRIDWRSIRVAEDAALRAGYDPHVDREVATFVGLFVTYGDLENRVSPGLNGAPRLGFGPDSLGAPAQLLVKSVKDLVVIKAGCCNQR